MNVSRQSIVGGLGVLALVSLSAFLPTPVSANDCGGPYPQKPANVWAKSGPGGGQVTLYWGHVDHANRYAVAYGTQSGNYLYGATNIGGESTQSYTVSGLASGQKYYFKIAAARDCSSSPLSDEVTAVSGFGDSGTWNNETSGEMHKASNLSAWSGPGVGQVTLKWWGRDDAENFNIAYGSNMNANEYGALNIGKTNQYTVKSLIPGKTYYFSVVPVGGAHSMHTLGPVSAQAKYPVEVVTIPQAQQITEPVSMATPEKMELISEEGDGRVLEEEEEEDYYYDEENSKVQGMMDNGDFESEENYVAENLNVAKTQTNQDSNGSFVQGTGDETESYNGGRYEFETETPRIGSVEGVADAQPDFESFNGGTFSFE